MAKKKVSIEIERTDHVLQNKSVDTIEKNLSRDDDRKYNLNAAFQRDFIWSDKQVDEYIHTILTNFIITVVTLIMISGEYFVVDGKQRLSAILKFLKGGYRIKTEGLLVNYKEPKLDSNGKQILDANGEPIMIKKTLDLKGKTFSDLPKAFQDVFNDYSILVEKYDEIDDEHIVSLFSRLNGGTPIGIDIALRVITYKKDQELIRRLDEVSNKYEELFNKILGETNVKRSKDTTAIFKAIMLRYYDINNINGGISSKDIRKFIVNNLDINLINDIDRLLGRLYEEDKALSKFDNIDGILPYIIASMAHAKNANNYLKTISSYFTKVDKVNPAQRDIILKHNNGTTSTSVVTYKRNAFEAIAKDNFDINYFRDL